MSNRLLCFLRKILALLGGLALDLLLSCGWRVQCGCLLLLLLMLLLKMRSCGWIRCHAVGAGHIVELVIQFRFKVEVEVRIKHGAFRLLIYVIHKLMNFTWRSSFEIRFIGHLQALLFAIPSMLLNHSIVEDTSN